MAVKLKTSSANIDPGRLSDFTTDLRVVPLSLIAIGLGVVSSYLAVFLLKLIGFFTNLFFFQRFGTELTSDLPNFPS